MPHPCHQGADVFRAALLEDGADERLLPFLEAVVAEFLPDIADPFAYRLAGHALAYLASALAYLHHQIELRTRRAEGIMPFAPPSTAAERKEIHEAPRRLAGDEPFLGPIQKHLKLLAEPDRTAMAMVLNRALGVRYRRAQA